MTKLWIELRRRKVVRVAVVYLIGAWVVLQVADTVLGLADFPDWVGQVLLAAAALGLPLALVLAWIFDLTPTGLVVTDQVDSPADKPFHYAEPAPIDVGRLELNRPQLAPLVGRDKEREVIYACLDAAVSGKGGIVLISGEPGVGKTRLAEEAMAQGYERDMLSLVGHAYEERGTPFITSTEILEEVARVLPQNALRNVLGSTAPEIARLLPDLRRVFPNIPEPVELPPDQQQRFLFNAVLEFLTRLSHLSPVVLMLDDLHWADDSSILLLEHLAPRLPNLPILMIATYRDVESDMGEPFKRALAQLSRQPYVTRMPLHRFTREDVTSLLSTMGAPDAPQNVVGAIFEETNGNAFFVQSVFRHLAEEGRLFDAEGHWLTEIDTESLAVPDSVRLVTGRRIAKLSRDTQDVLAIAAVMGLRFRLPVLEAAVAARDSVVDAIEEADAAHLIKQSVGGRELRYEFVHALARQTLLTSLSAPRQQGLHMKIASAVEATYGADLEHKAADLAYHLVEAGSLADAEKVIHWSFVAGNNAMAAAAFEEAVHYFSTAIAVADDRDEELQADLLHARGAAQLSLGRKQGFLEDLQLAYSLYEQKQTGEKAARVAADISYIYVWDAQPGQAFALVSRALELLGNEESPGRCQLLSAQGLAHTIGRQPARAERSHEAAVAMARKLDEPGLLADVLQNQALANWQRLCGEIQELPAHEAASLRREKNQEWNLGHCLWMEKAGLVFQGRFDEAEGIDEELNPIAGRNGDFGSLGCSALMSSTIAQARGDLEKSSHEMRRSIELFEAGGFPWGVFSEGHYSVNELLRGNYEEARRAFEFAGDHRLAGISWSGCETCYWLSGKANLGDPDILEAYRSIESDLPEAGRAMASGAVQLLEGSIEALVVAGYDEEAAGLYPVIRDFVDSGLGLLAFTYGLHERFAGMAAAAGRDWRNAEAHYEKALTLAKDLPHRVDQARVRYWYARMLLDRSEPGDCDRAQSLLDDARKLSEEMGLRGLIDSIDGLAPKSHQKH
jgi:hypothetical protein